MQSLSVGLEDTIGQAALFFLDECVAQRIALEEVVNLVNRVVLFA
jgi:hypothetical protein